MKCKNGCSNVCVDEKVLIPSDYGPATAITFKNLSKEHIIFAFGDWAASPAPRVRIHSECLTGDVFGSQRCDCGPQLQEAMKTFSKSSGLILYMRQEGRGIGLVNKMRAYRLQDTGLDTYAANRALGFENDARDFREAAEMLKALGIRQVNLLSNNPRKASQLEANGICVSHRCFTETYVGTHNQNYLSAKANEGGHDGLQIITQRYAK